MLTARNVHATAVPRVDVEHILDALAAMPADERRTVPGLNPERADIIVAGLAVAAEVMARVEARELAVSRYGIREGLLLEAARVVPAVADPGAARERSVREFAERCHFEEAHAAQVQRLALRLFDALGARIGCTRATAPRSPTPRCCTTSATTSTTTGTTSIPTTSSCTPSCSASRRRSRWSSRTWRAITAARRRRRSIATSACSRSRCATRSFGSRPFFGSPTASTVDMWDRWKT